jgi:hypothetical protein
MFDDRRSNLAFARCLERLISETRSRGMVLDLDAFYASNSIEIFEGLGEDAKHAFLIVVPGIESSIEEEIIRAVVRKSGVLIVDNLNTLFHLIALHDSSNRARKISFAIEVLSFAARANGFAVLLPMYRRDGVTRSTTNRFLSGFSDSLVSATVKEQELQLSCERGGFWKDGLSIRIPSESPG